MNELENQELQEQGASEQQPTAEEETAAAAQPLAEGKIQTEPTPFTGPDAAAAPTPVLTLEPEPPADPFADLPEPPRAPEPPKSAPPQQPTPPQYTQPQYTQYTGAPQQNAVPQYNAYYTGQPQQPYQQPAKTYYNVAPAGYQQKSRLAAGLLAITLGMFGVHNFYLRFNSRATIQLVVSIVGFLLSIIIIGIFAVIAMAIWGFVEGVQILAANNPERLYDANCVILRD